jgi:1-pyrroline-4-hydroxy-2-carboxylate deaminase
MPASPWTGVFPAVTTKFTPSQDLDIAAMERHLQAQLEAGVHGLVVLGSLGENGTLTREEKLEILRTAVRVASGKVPVLSAVAETTTRGAAAFAEAAIAAGADGLMVLPPMQYVSDRRETLQHFRAVAHASDRPIMIYNNPVAYRVDITPEMFAELADEPKFVALKESSDDVRRITGIIRLTGERYRIFVGVDDLAMESLLMGAVGWVAGLVCAFPRETVALYTLVREGHLERARELYRWFSPLLKLDTDIKFVQYIKMAEAMTGLGTEQVRAPRLALEGEERERIAGIIRSALASRPRLSK